MASWGIVNCDSDIVVSSIHHGSQCHLNVNDGFWILGWQYQITQQHKTCLDDMSLASTFASNLAHLFGDDDPDGPSAQKWERAGDRDRVMIILKPLGRPRKLWILQNLWSFCILVKR